MVKATAMNVEQEATPRALASSQLSGTSYAVTVQMLGSISSANAPRHYCKKILQGGSTKAIKKVQEKVS